MPGHIYMTVSLEGDALFLQERALPFPSGSGTPHLVDYTMTREKGCSGRISKGTAYHT
jgi:hypothetical protein